MFNFVMTVARKKVFNCVKFAYRGAAARLNGYRFMDQFRELSFQNILTSRELYRDH
jgi:hypothetical protein